MARSSANELLERYPDAAWREKFVDIVDLIDVLKDCVIPNTYSIPDDLNEAIALTEAGSSLKSRLIRKEGVPAKEAHLLCALAIGHDELFIDVESTKIHNLRSSISRQILNGDIRFAFIFGRDLYSAFAEQFEDERDSLTPDETIRLLDAIPIGVFQYGRFVIGTSGITSSSHGRNLRFSKRVPAFHCSDPVCRVLHSVILNTGHNAPINAQRYKLAKILDAKTEPESDWTGLAIELTRLTQSYFSSYWFAPMVTLLGDCLSTEELALVISEIEPEMKIEGRPALLERALMEDDKDLAACLDRLVLSGQIVVPKGEIRIPVSTAHLRAGAYRLQPQLGEYGVRFVSGDPGLPTLRQRDLVRRLYLADNESERHELEWHLREIDGVSLESKLEEYLRNTPPEEALARLVLSRSSSAIAASEVAGLGDLDDLSNAEVVARLSWKLGFDRTHSGDAHAEFWQKHEKLAAIVQTGLGAGPGDTSVFKGQAATYFTELEGLLQDSLAFASWAFLRDHLNAGRPFSYDNETDRRAGLQLLQEFYDDLAPKKPKESLRFTDRLTMFSIVRGFGVLSEALRAIERARDKFVRGSDEFPDFGVSDSLQQFPFRSTVPFLDLADHSRVRIIEGLGEVESTLDATKLSRVRNDYMHYRRTSPELAAMEATLESVGRAVRSIENLGIGLSLCHPSARTMDQWGRSNVTYVGPRSLEHVIARPSSLQWVGLPSLRVPQYLVRSAAFDDANEVLRFERRYESDFARMWDNYPAPRKKAPSSVDGAMVPEPLPS